MKRPSTLRRKTGWRSQHKKKETICLDGEVWIPVNPHGMAYTLFPRVNKQPKDGDKDREQTYQDDSTDLLGLVGESTNAENSGTTETTRTGRSVVRHSDGLIYRQPGNPMRWSRRVGGDNANQEVGNQQDGAHGASAQAANTGVAMTLEAETAQLEYQVT